jgi:CTP-dependent riboflavin kinase
MSKNKENDTSTKTVRLKGKVFSGSGEGAYFTMLPWVRQQIKEKLGFAPYPGTLNVRLVGEYVGVRKLLENAKAIEISPEHGYCSGKCFKARVGGQNLACAVVLPCVENYPMDILEIIAPSNLREKLGLRDGDEVEVRITLE